MGLNRVGGASLGMHSHHILIVQNTPITSIEKVLLINSSKEHCIMESIRKDIKIEQIHNSNQFNSKCFNHPNLKFQVKKIQ